MGLWWTIYGRARPGREAEHARLTARIHRILGGRARPTARQRQSGERAFARRAQISLPVEAEAGPPPAGELTFPAEIVAGAAPVLGEELSAAAAQPHTAEQGLDYAALLDQRLGEYLDGRASERLSAEDTLSVQRLLEAVRWLRYWAHRGHGFEPLTDTSGG